MVEGHIHSLGDLSIVMEGQELIHAFGILSLHYVSLYLKITLTGVKTEFLENSFVMLASQLAQF